MVKSVKTVIYLKNDYNDQDILDLMRDLSKRYQIIPKKFGAEYLLWGQFLQLHLKPHSITEPNLVSISKKIWKLFETLNASQTGITLDAIHKHLISELIQTVDKSCCDVCGKETKITETCIACQSIVDSAP